jgi:CheY-like chemotaxis protein
LGEILIQQPDMVLMDNRLSDGLGSEFCHKLKSDPATKHFPVILISANTDLALIDLLGLLLSILEFEPSIEQSKKLNELLLIENNR